MSNFIISKTAQKAILFVPFVLAQIGCPPRARTDKRTSPARFFYLIFRI